MSFEAGSFRDRAARIFYADGEILRTLSARGLEDWEALRSTRFFTELVAGGELVATEQVPGEAASTLPDAGAWAAVLRHQRIPFISYPYEWSAGMLRAAALLQLDLLDRALEEDFVLKDASPYNVQWFGSRPVFIDVLSFCRWHAGDPWLGYRQFCELFLYPLMLEAYKGVPFQPWLRGSIDGIPPAQAARLLCGRDLLRRGVFTHVFLHARADARFRATNVSTRRELASAGFGKELIRANVRRLRKVVRRLRATATDSVWVDYGQDNSYSPEDRAAKSELVRLAVSERRWGMVWDLGANTGEFARLAAEHADYVVALDADRSVVDRLFEQCRREGRKNLLPLVADLANPSPNQGWRGLERRDLVSRGAPDLMLALALIHHLVLGANIRLTDLLDWLAGLAPHLVIEFVRREDPMVERLLRNKEDLYTDYDLGLFEAELGRRFRVLRRQELPSGRRVLYFAQRLTTP
ncbi:MAG: class I SAM-dependent methyltransferase [Thermoanaerobaculia bacterium]